MGRSGRNTGNRVPLTEQVDAATVNGQLGDSNMAPRSIGVGDPHRIVDSRRRAGNSVYAKKPLVGASGTEFIVPHDLGDVATRVAIASQGPRGYVGILSVKPSREETWTHSTVRVIVETTGANLNGAYALFEISGR